MKKAIRLTENDLRIIIKESVKKVLNEDGTMFYKGQVFKYKGDFDAKQKKAWLAWKKTIDDAEARERGEEVKAPVKKKRATKSKTDDAMVEGEASPRALALNVKNLIYDKSLKSIYVFFTHGSISFGNNAMKKISALYNNNVEKNLFFSYNELYRCIEKTISEIESWGRKNEHAVYDRARKLSFYLRDMGEVLGLLSSKTDELRNNGTFKSLGDIPVLVGRGNGRELGLLNLPFAKQTSLRKVQQRLYSSAESLEQIADAGRNPFDYDID